MTGQITKIFFDRGFAFVAGQYGTRYFLHATAMADTERFDDLQVDQWVEFEVRDDPKGPRAVNLRAKSETTQADPAVLEEVAS